MGFENSITGPLDKEPVGCAPSQNLSSYDLPSVAVVNAWFRVQGSLNGTSLAFKGGSTVEVAK
jgi:hypothetical protein